MFTTTTTKYLTLIITPRHVRTSLSLVYSQPPPVRHSLPVYFSSIQRTRSIFATTLSQFISQAGQSRFAVTDQLLASHHRTRSLLSSATSYRHRSFSSFHQLTQIARDGIDSLIEFTMGKMTGNTTKMMISWNGRGKVKPIIHLLERRWWCTLYMQTSSSAIFVSDDGKERRRTTYIMAMLLSRCSCFLAFSPSRPPIQETTNQNFVDRRLCPNKQCADQTKLIVITIPPHYKTSSGYSVVEPNTQPDNDSPLSPSHNGNTRHNNNYNNNNMIFAILIWCVTALLGRKGASITFSIICWIHVISPGFVGTKAGCVCRLPNQLTFLPHNNRHHNDNIMH